MTELVLNPVTLKALANAHSIVAFQDGDAHWLTIYPTEDYNIRTEFSLPGFIVGHDGNLAGRSTPGSSAISLPTTGRNLFKLLKSGDRLSLEWFPDNSNQFLDRKGMTKQSLNLVVRRQVGGGKSKREDMITLRLAESLFDDSISSTAMCKGFPHRGRRQAA